MTSDNFQSAVPKPKLRWYQYRLRTLFIVTTLLAVVLSLWPRSRIPPSPLWGWRRLPCPTDEIDPVQRVFKNIVPKAMVRRSGGGNGGNATSRSGRWHSKQDALIHCSRRFADQVMRQLRTDTKLSVQKAGAEVTDGGEVVSDSLLTAFDFSYSFGVNKGVIKVTIEPGDSFVSWDPPQRPEDVDPDWRPPFFQLHWDVEETAGPQEH